MKIIKDNKWYIIIFIVSIVLSISFFIFFNSNSKTESLSYVNYINIDNQGFIKNDSGVYSFISFKEMKNKNFKIIRDKEFLGTMTYDNYDEENQISIYRKENRHYNFHAPFIGIDEDTNLIQFSKEKLTSQDISYVNKYFKKNIVSLDELHNSYKVNMDFDGDGENETLYVVTYLEYLDESSEEKSPETDSLTDGFSLVFFIDNNYLTKIAESEINIYNDDFSELAYYSVANVLDFNLDKKYEILLQVAINDNPSYKLLGFENDTLKIVLNKINDR